MELDRKGAQGVERFTVEFEGLAVVGNREPEDLFVDGQLLLQILFTGPRLTKEFFVSGTQEYPLPSSLTLA